jgi:hypothetical protein
MRLAGAGFTPPNFIVGNRSFTVTIEHGAGKMRTSIVFSVEQYDV